MRCALSLMAVLLATAMAATPQDDEYTQETLQGLKGVRVLIENLHPDAARDGLDKTTIQTDVELKLRQTGIKVLTETEWLAAAGAPYLYIHLDTCGGETGRYAFSIEVSLQQMARLERDPKIVAIRAATWSSGSIGTVGRANLQDIRNSIKDHVDKFINAWLSVNPKQ